jgi:hypothetical protein
VYPQCFLENIGLPPQNTPLARGKFFLSLTIKKNRSELRNCVSEGDISFLAFKCLNAIVGIMN